MDPYLAVYKYISKFSLMRYSHNNNTLSRFGEMVIQFLPIDLDHPVYREGGGEGGGVGGEGRGR